jgi:hypothetical protein
MQTAAPEVRSQTIASQQAQKNWDANRKAISTTQPWLLPTLGALPSDVEWVFARDGSLTAMENNRWWSGCSVPLLAGRTLLRTLAEESVSSCLLAPAHAGVVRAGRELMGKYSVLFVAQPDLRSAQMILACHDFSADISNRRWWIVTGPRWLEEFHRLFEENPGLSTPLRFIRTKLTVEDITLPMIKAIQDMFALVLTARGRQIDDLKASTAAPSQSKTILLVGGTEYRLWEPGTMVLQQQLAQHKADLKPYDTDNALCGSPLALLQQSQGCGCIVSANICRADCNGLITEQIPWITWMTMPGAPAFTSAGPKDGLILADPQWRAIAQAAGWPAARVHVCGWPAVPAGASAGADALGIICDTRKIEIPETIANFSSHRLLWDLIEEELAANPLVVEDMEAYLTNRAGQLNIATESLDRLRFNNELIQPAYQQGLARLLIAAGLPIRIWGKGWGNLPEFVKHTIGAVESEADYTAALASCRALMYCWPRRAAHPIQVAGKPIVYRQGGDRSALIRAAKTALSAPLAKLGMTAVSTELGSLVLKLTLGPKTN